ncbi:MAG: ABC transporter permease, partial [Gemmatimonadota bacterium]|nr:ABC transporter permease [Gemmatimonadota bacterium]
VTVAFVLLQLAPGDPARFWVGPAATQDDLETARRALGLDRPLLTRYLAWVTGFVRGDWGSSLAQHRPVREVLGAALPATLLLSGTSLLVTYLGGIIVGLVQAVKRARPVDTLLTIVTVVVYGLPAYWVALVLVLVFAYAAARLGWPAWLQFPAMGVQSLDADFLSPGARLLDRLEHLALPLVTLGALGVAGTARFVRGAALDVLTLDFVRAARARGISGRRVLTRHVLRNALLPVITLLGLALPALFSGTVFVEVIFAWPGMGRELVGAVAARDYPVVLAATAVFGTLVVTGNLLADLLYAVADPRMRAGREGREGRVRARGGAWGRGAQHEQEGP